MAVRLKEYQYIGRKVKVAQTGDQLFIVSDVDHCIHTQTRFIKVETSLKGFGPRLVFSDRNHAWRFI